MPLLNLVLIFAVYGLSSFNIHLQKSEKSNGTFLVSLKLLLLRIRRKGLISLVKDSGQNGPLAEDVLVRNSFSP